MQVDKKLSVSRAKREEGLSKNRKEKLINTDISEKRRGIVRKERNLK